MARRRPQLRKKRQTASNGSNPTVGINLDDSDSDTELDVGLGSIDIETTLFEEGDTTVKVVAGIDLSPATLDVNYDSTTGELAIAGEVGIPGDLAGITGGITVDTDTGEVTAITGGAAVAGLEITFEQGIGTKSCRQVGTITFFGVGISYVVDNCEDAEDKDEEEEEEKDESQGDFESGPYKFDRNRFLPDKMILAVLSWRWARYGYRKIEGAELLEVSDGNLAYPKEKILESFVFANGIIDKIWTNQWHKLFLRQKFEFSFNDWEVSIQGVFSQKEYGPFEEETYLIRASSEDRSITPRGLSGPFGFDRTEAGVPCFFFGTYGNFLRYIETNVRGQTLAVADYPQSPFGFVTSFEDGTVLYYSGPIRERIVLNVDFYDENGFIGPPRRRPPPPLPPTRRRRRDPMSDNCCQANLTGQ